MDWPERIAPEVRVGVKRAVAWRTITEIVRHHPDLDLRLTETHPCGGQYDCLTLVIGTACATVCSFNLHGTGLEIGAPVGRPRELPWWLKDHAHSNVWRYPQHGLGEDRGALALAIEARLGFPVRRPGDPPATATGLALGVVAELLDRVALGCRPVDVRSGWLDTSYDVGVRAWARGKPGVSGVPETAPWPARARAASRFWSLSRDPDPEAPALVVDLASTQVWARGRPGDRMVDRFNAGAGVRGLAWWLEEELDR
jgi:hypothetical protein